MVDIVRDMSLAEFKKNASRFYPHKKKILIKSGRTIAIYNPKTKRVTKA